VHGRDTEPSHRVTGGYACVWREVFWGVFLVSLAAVRCVVHVGVTPSVGPRFSPMTCNLPRVRYCDGQQVAFWWLE
jgi:hypothetical protein